ncbi:MAG TPA: ester cyclase [Aggregatilinea sp.]|uniref:ester cyclase n=1 Tax=Aggregatilinea sp. TaxID=2806333 RepID=UPI002CD2277D|nr:ester cyclase [Aggregatilinea sp.]HML21789.1 ester cyclase [Aggregatilinea sp.]
MSTEQNKALARRLVDEVLNRGNLNVIDEIISPDFIEHEELPPGMPSGRDAPRAMFGMLHSAFPDFKATIQQLIAEGDKVVFHMTWTGTQQGEFMGLPASGRRVSFDVIDIVSIVDGKATEHWGIMDRAKMLEQLGAMPG